MIGSSVPELPRARCWQVFGAGVRGRSTSGRFFDHTRPFGPYWTGPVRFGVFDPFSIHMVQATSRRHAWTATASNSSFSAWSHQLGSYGTPASTHREQHIGVNFLVCTKKTKLFVTFPEDFGTHSQEGPSSIWSLREFQLLHGVSEACRGSGFLCQLGQANFRRPIGILTNIASLFDQLYKGWPCLLHDKEDLQYRGPLPNHCPCVPQHHNLKGVDAADHFISASSHTLGERFWSCFFFVFNRHRTTVFPWGWRYGFDDCGIFILAVFVSTFCSLACRGFRFLEFTLRVLEEQQFHGSPRLLTCYLLTVFLLIPRPLNLRP